ncbi:CRISPR-associated protein Cmr4 [Thermococcus eurythermalis]|uniref:CRISPR-associated protein Cmr4 n=1 Tax=Thermococcus eurythermalis TaxID=1505907 RepID=A0A097QWC1_9EURY|nr:type III-B CRISPR module RAMP protein Cmr4 [Thermococcus eurythermalis]AIU70779.1 CRISPR-associated protein Cmr4 [Thermococcus eurythermalis]
MYSERLVLGIYAVTPVHAGSGAEVSVIDLPIQRERHTGFPVIWGQSLKGVLRSAFKETGELEEVIKAIFGPEPGEKAHEHAGAIAVGDAKVLLFPVRSAKGVFAYVTCPLVLKRFKEDMELAGKEVNFSVPEPKENEAIVSENSAVELSGKVVLEEVALEAKGQDLTAIASELKKLLPEGIDLEERLVIVHDDVFTAFVKLATEIVARVAIDQSTGTVRRGGLWYEEFLPRDTLLYAVIAAGNPRVTGVGGLRTASEVKDKLGNFLTSVKYLQIGGDETVGKGFVRVVVRR